MAGPFHTSQLHDPPPPPPPPGSPGRVRHALQYPAATPTSNVLQPGPPYTGDATSIT